MWMLAFIPDSWLHLAIHGTVALGILALLVGSFAKLFFSSNAYGTIISVSGFVILLAGVFFEGGYGVEMSWRAKVEEVQAKVDEAKKASDTANAQLTAERKKKQKVVKEYITTVKERIVEKQAQIDAKCELDPSVPQILNDAARIPVKKSSVEVEVKSK